MKIMKEETFGPEISVMEFSTEEETIQLKIILNMDSVLQFGLVI